MKFIIHTKLAFLILFFCQLCIGAEYVSGVANQQINYKIDKEFSDIFLQKICVLSFFEENSYLQSMVNNTFGKYPKAKIFNYAQISDIEHCLLSGKYEEVVWLAHGNSVRNSISDYSAPILINSPFPISTWKN